MDLIHTFIDYVLHLDAHLTTLVNWAGVWTYVVLALIIFCETGLVVTPFLPGDSLLFAVGALAAATGSLNITILFLLLTTCAVVGDAANYWFGSKFGEQAAAGRLPLVKKEHIQRTHEFYERHGGKTIILARFVPIIRTFAPFVAGAGTMTYQRFAVYNITGGVAWVGAMLFAGYFFGNIPFVKENFSAVVLAIIVLSVIPGVVAVWQERRRIMAERTSR